MRTWWSGPLTERRRRGRADTQDAGPGVWWLLLDELRAGARETLHPAKLAAAAAVAAVTILAFGPFTPGLTLPREARLTLAIALGLAAGAVAHALLRTRPDADPARTPRLLLAAVALLLTGTVLTGYLLSIMAGSTQPPAANALTAGLAVDRTLLTGAALLTAGALSTAVGNRLRVPALLLFLGLGMLIGDDGLDWVSLSDPLLVQSVGVAALVVILFEGGLTTDVRQLRRGAAPGVLLATVGVALTAGVTALGAIWLLDLPERTAWVVGAVVASTDAAAVFDLLRRAPLPGRLAAVLKVESGANDPVAVLLTVGLLQVWDVSTSTTAWLAFGALQLLGGAAVGGALGWLGAQLLRRVRLGAPGLYPVLALGLAAEVGASGFLATYVAGIVLAAEAPRRRTSLRAFHTALAGGVEVGLFLLLGLEVFPSELPRIAVTALGVAATLILVARPVACTVSLLPLGYTPREIAAVSWLGMRGAAPIVLATFAASAGTAEARAIFDVVFFIVVVSALAQGTTADRVIRALGLAVQGAPRDVVEAALPLDDSDIDVLELRLTTGSPLVGRELQTLGTPADVLIVAVIRGQEVLIPRGTTRLCAADVLVVTTSDAEDGVNTVTRWAGQETDQ
jgi:cell volume regulation protein A